MEKLRNLVGEARRYIGIAIDFLKKLLLGAERADDALEEVEEQLEEEQEKPKE